MRSRGMSELEATTYFGISVEMLRWRVRMMGVDYQVEALNRSHGVFKKEA